MLIPVVISALISTLLMNLNPVANDFENKINSANASERGEVLGVFEKMKRIPEGINKVAGFSNKLPESKSVNFPPRRNSGTQSLTLDVASGMVIDKNTDTPLWDKRSQEIRPIASISKLMTALVFLENNPGWDSIYKIKEGDRREGGRIYLNTGEEVRVRDLFYLSLVGSANTATMALVGSTGMSEREFIKRMNKKAREMGLTKTNFSDPSGLSRFNVSTAYEILKMAKEAFSNNDIKDVTLRRDYSFRTLSGRDVFVESTDKLLEVFPENGINIIGGKTGYTQLAGFCFVGQFVNNEGREILSVVLGSKTIDDRFKHTKDLVEWIFSSYIW